MAIKRIHVSDGGELEQVSNSWVGGCSNPQYRCKLCGKFLSASDHEGYAYGEKTSYPPPFITS